jgi:membrane-bound ClpP family serine protease
MKTTVFLLCLSFLAFRTSFAQTDSVKGAHRVLVIEIANEVDAGMASYVERSVAQAESETR